MASEFTGRGAPLSSDGFTEVTERLRVTAAAVWAVLRVETVGCGFLPDRRPKILFERHLFHRETGGRFSQSHPGISQPTAGGYGPGGAPQYDRLAEALALDRRAALDATSWGLGQVLGRNCQAVGFADVEAMVGAMRDSEDRQLEAMAGFLLTNRLDAALRAENWTDFARRYNGPDYARNQYDTRLAAEYRRLVLGPLPDLTVREGQVYLWYLGHDPGPIDGVLGRRTRAAIGEFARREGLGDVDDLGPELLARLRAKASSPPGADTAPTTIGRPLGDAAGRMRARSRGQRLGRASKRSM